MAKLDTRLGRDENDVNSSSTQAAKCKSTRKWTGYQSQYMESYSAFLITIQLGQFAYICSSTSHSRLQKK